MNTGELRTLEHRRQALLDQLKTAEAALRGALHRPCTDHPVREHLERALAHVHEAYIAVNESRTVRTVQQLVEDLTRIEQACSELRQQPPPGVTIKSLRV
jgi:hypothetical protein